VLAIAGQVLPECMRTGHHVQSRKDSLYIRRNGKLHAKNRICSLISNVCSIYISIIDISISEAADAAITMIPLHS
jgi:hypothetical protein